MKFVKMSIETAQKLTLPVCIDALRITEENSSIARLASSSMWLKDICALDAHYHLNINNSITRRASLNQAKCFLRASVEAFSKNIFERGTIATMKLELIQHLIDNNEYDEYGNVLSVSQQDKDSSSILFQNTDSSSKKFAAIANACRGLKFQGHYAVIFGVVTGLMGLSAIDREQLEAIRFTFLRCIVRDVLSCATRLNIVGTYDAAAMQFDCCRVINKMLLSARNTTEEEEEEESTSGLVRVVTTCPILEILQGKHDALYARLFTS